jgi:hypothetical protein
LDIQITAALAGGLALRRRRLHQQLGLLARQEDMTDLLAIRAAPGRSSRIFSITSAAVVAIFPSMRFGGQTA